MCMTTAYEKILYANTHIKETVTRAKAQGKKVIGVAPVFAPVELIHAAGMLPISCWGGELPLVNASTYLPGFACSVMQEMTELAVIGAYDDLDGMLISCACDTLKCTGQNLAKILKKTKMIYCRYPQHNTTAAGKAFFMAELKTVKEKLEEIAGKKITEEALYHSIAIYHENRKAVQECIALMQKNPGVVSARMRHHILTGRGYLPIEEHTALVNEINAALREIEPKPFSGKKVYLSGIMAAPIALFDVFDALNIVVVGDELAQETQQFQPFVPDGLDQLERLADQWAKVEESVFILDIGKRRAKAVARKAKAAGADGIIFLLMMFCDLEEYDAPYIKDYAHEAGMPFLSVEVQQNMQSVAQLRTRIQAFVETMA